MTMHLETTRYNMTVNDLLKLDVNKNTEKKGNLTYLSWAWAWAEALKADANAHFQVQMFGDKCYTDINGTYMVWVTVTMFGKPMTCQLPVMDHRNKAIIAPDAFAGDEPGMYGEWESITDNEVRLRVWNTLNPDSKVRSAIKAYKEKLKESK